MPAMCQLVNLLLAIDEAHTVPERTLDCRPGFGGLNQVMGLTVLLPTFRVSVVSIGTDVQIEIKTKIIVMQ